jgi:phenylalanyl-tRNA synthetase beta chain
MKFTLSWLREHLDTMPRSRRSPPPLRHRPRGRGRRGPRAALAAFRIARVIEAVQHPNADRLRALRVDVGDGREYSVVCGAPNARTGMMACGAARRLHPGTGITLKAGEIRGVKSKR